MMKTNGLKLCQIFSKVNNYDFSENRNYSKVINFNTHSWKPYIVNKLSYSGNDNIFSICGPLIELLKTFAKYNYAK